MYLPHEKIGKNGEVTMLKFFVGPNQVIFRKKPSGRLVHKIKPGKKRIRTRGGKKKIIRIGVRKGILREMIKIAKEKIAA